MHTPISILLADDDRDDQELITSLLKKVTKVDEIEVVGDGQALITRLTGEKSSSKLPNLIILDINMPRMNGLEALKIIKGDDRLKKIPVIVLTVSESQADVLKSYDIGANAFVSKSMLNSEFTEVVKKLGSFWFDIVKLPNR